MVLPGGGVGRKAKIGIPGPLKVVLGIVVVGVVAFGGIALMMGGTPAQTDVTVDVPFK